MSLPAAISYPTPTDLPPSKAAWELDPARAAILVHDMQRYFLRPFASDAPVLLDAVAHTARLLDLARELGIPVFYTAQTGKPSDVVRGLQGDLWGPGMQPIPEHTEIIPQLAPGPNDTVMVKHRYSAFAHSDFGELLAAGGRDQLILTGVYAHIGVTATAFDAFQREIHPFLIADAVADFSADSHDRALAQIASCAGVVTTTAEVFAALAPRSNAESTTMTEIDQLVRDSLTELLDADTAAAAFADPESDLFALGLDSVRSFDLLDALADVGVDVDFGEFSRTASVSYLRSVAQVA